MVYELKMKNHRLFFALWPSDQVRSSIVKTFSQLPQKINGSAMQAENMHITLHFVGSVAEEEKDCLHAAAQSVSAEVFQLELDRFGYFSRAKIFWMGCRELPVELTPLHNKLGAAIENCGYQQEKRAYTPHVTLMRKCSKPGSAQIEFSIPWSIEEFVLVESVTYKAGVSYQVIEKYPLV